MSVGQLGPYVLVDELGKGGMCTVYRAIHSDLGTEFAIKVLHHAHINDDAYVERLRREAAAGFRIQNPRIVKILELGVSEHGPFLVMELIHGRTLWEVLRDEGALLPARAARIARQIAEGLGAAHRAGYVHRDLKPGNIMIVPLAEGEQVKVLDLGIVRIHDGAWAQITAENLILGTPSYMAPEQFHSSQVGPAADLYALGIILSEMLAGKPPFAGTFREIISQHMVAAPPALPPSGGLETIVARLLEKKAEFRPSSAEEVVEDIDRLFPETIGSVVPEIDEPFPVEFAPPLPMKIIRGRVE